MCGIVAVVGASTCVEEPLRKALATLHRRGPDGQGVWLSDSGLAGLGHTRLAINNLPEGHQPFFWGVGDRYVGIVNGEFYGSAPQHGSDSWILRDQWQRHGFPDLICHLRGEFSWVVYDRQQKKLFAARDRFGIKPLFWGRIHGALWLASKPCALWAAGLSPGWSEVGFWRASATQYPPLGGSLFSQIQEVPPGHWLCASGGQTPRLGRYWSLGAMTQSDDEDHLARFRMNLLESVALRVRPDAVTAVALSGGVDSASVLALAHCALPDRPLHAFSVDFPGPDHPMFSEVHLARAQCDHFGIEHHTVVSLDVDQLLHGLEPTVQGALGLLVNAHGVAKFRLAQAISEQGIRVVLSGEGADELLFGYRHFAPHLPGADLCDPLADPAGLGILTSRGGAHGLANVEAVLGFRPEIWVSKWQLGQRIRAFLRPEFCLAYSDRDPFLECLEETDVDPRMRPWEVVRALWLSSALRSYILEVLGDGCEMAHSVEGRPPFLDHRLWEAVAGTPLPLITAAPGKAILRQAVGGLLTPAIRSRPKHPFMAPPLGQPLRTALRQALSDRDHPYVDRARALQRLAEIESLRGPEAWEWEPALLWVLSSYHLQALWSN